MIRAILFDLDDTLYDEADYVASGFGVVATAIAEHCEAKPEAILDFMLAELARNGRGRVFDATLDAFGLPAAKETIEHLVERYRSHAPVLGLYPDADRVLTVVRPDYRLAVVTDGLPLMQRAKLQALGLPDRVDTAVCCWEHDVPKPDPGGYRIALERLGVEISEAVIVGDRPDHDMAAAIALGGASVRIRRGRFARLSSASHPADHEIAILDELPGILARLLR